MTTPEQLAELERLERAATPGPVVMWGGQGWPRAWNVVADADVVWPVAHRDTPSDAEPFAVFLRPEDQRHYAAMRNTLPSLLQAARRLGEVEAAMRDLAESGRRAEDERCAQLTTANARIAKLEAERDEVDLDETLAALAAVRTRAAAAERRVAELERAAEDRRQELESERAAKNHALATVRANLDAAERRVAELEAENVQLKHEGEVLGALYVGDAPPKDAARALVERARAAERARDEALRRAKAAEGELGEVWRKLGRARGELAPGSDVLRSTAHDLRALDPETVATLDPKGVKP